MNVSASEELYARARRVIPGGVNSPVRAFGAVGGTPRFAARGEGPYLFDVDGNRLVDFVCSWGPLIAGHAHPAVVDAARAALAGGSSYGVPTEGEIALAETIVAAVPGVEQVRLVSSGTEAGMSAIRLARGFTGRDKVVKFAGHYHGHADALLVSAGSGVATLGLPDSPGVTRGATADTIVVDWNDRAGVEKAFAEHGDDIAVVACEPVAANMGVVPPVDGYLAFLREITRAHEALLLFDEVMTGFRVARGGMTALSGVTPDVVTFGKIVGGGFPLAAFGGRADVMARLAPEGPVYQAGTLSGNPVAVAAGLAQLRLLDDATFTTLETVTDRVVAAFRAAFTDAGVEAQVVQHGTLAGLVFAGSPPRDYDDAAAADHRIYARFFHAMLERGVYLAPSGYEVVFTSLALDDAAIMHLVEAAASAAQTLAGR